MFRNATKYNEKIHFRVEGITNGFLVFFISNIQHNTDYKITFIFFYTGTINAEIKL